MDSIRSSPTHTSVKKTLIYSEQSISSGLVDVNDAEKCDCPRECDTTTYEADMSYANYATQFISEQAVKDGVIMFNNTLR